MACSVVACQRNVRFIIRVVITLLAMAICSYQLYIVSRLYYRYPTTVDIRLDPSPFVNLPGVTICSELSSTILVEELVKIQPSLYKTFAGKTRTQISLMLKKRQLREQLLNSLHSLPIDQQHKLTVSSDKFFKQCELPKPLGRYLHNTNLTDFDKLYQTWGMQSYSRINCTKFTPIVESISYEFKCFTLFRNKTAQLGANADYQIPRDVAANLKYLAWIQLNRDFMFNGLIYIHSPDMSHQFTAQSNNQQLDPDKHQFVSISFERQVLRLLPPPYSTNCRNYRDDGFVCRDECLTKCKVYRYKEIDGWPGDVYAGKNVTQMFSKLWTNPWSINGHMEEGVDIEKLAGCSAECGQWDDCDSVSYNVRVERVHGRDEMDQQESHTFTIGILPPRSLDIINQHVPKFEPIEFLIYVGSLISLYLGISVVSISVDILSCLTFSSKFQSSFCCCCADGPKPKDKTSERQLDEKKKNPTNEQPKPEQLKLMDSKL